VRSCLFKEPSGALYWYGISEGFLRSLGGTWEVLSFPRAIGGVVLATIERELSEKNPLYGPKKWQLNIWECSGVDQLSDRRELVIGGFDFRGRKLSAVGAVISDIA
jgi:hypothetical protein